MYSVSCIFHLLRLGLHPLRLLALLLLLALELLQLLLLMAFELLHLLLLLPLELLLLELVAALKLVQRQSEGCSSCDQTRHDDQRTARPQ